MCVRVQVLALGLLYTQALMVGNYQYLIQDMFHTTVLASCMALTDPAQVGPGQGGGGCWRHAWRSQTPCRWGQDRGEGVLASCMALTDPAQVEPGQGGEGCWRHAWRSRTPRRWGQDRGEGGARGLRLTPNPIIVFAWGAMTPWFLLTHTHIFIRAGCRLLGWQAGRQAGKPSAGRQAGVGEGAGGALNPNSLKPAKAEGAASGWPNRAATLTLS